MGHLLQPARPDAVGASLVFLHLLVGDAERIGQVLLAHCKHNAAHAHPAADMLVDGARDLLRSNCIAKRHGSPLAKSYEQKNRPDAGTFDLPIWRPQGDLPDKPPGRSWQSGVFCLSVSVQMPA